VAVHRVGHAVSGRRWPAEFRHEQGVAGSPGLRLGVLEGHLLLPLAPAARVVAADAERLGEAVGVERETGVRVARVAHGGGRPVVEEQVRLVEDQALRVGGAGAGHELARELGQ
jgi:hypothetical protein